MHLYFIGKTAPSATTWPRAGQISHQQHCTAPVLNGSRGHRFLTLRIMGAGEAVTIQMGNRKDMEKEEDVQEGEGGFRASPATGPSLQPERT